jgi:hypothetical protein
VWRKWEVTEEIGPGKRSVVKKTNECRNSQPRLGGGIVSSPEPVKKVDEQEDNFLFADEISLHSSGVLKLVAPAISGVTRPNQVTPNPNL